MKICPYHLSALRDACAKRRVTDHFKAEALILANAVEHSPTFALDQNSPCPICTFIVPSWIDKAAASIQAEENGEEYQKEPS